MGKQPQTSKMQNMWVFAMFDLPTDDKEKRNAYTKFRKLLLADGFVMLQYSVYARFCESRAHSEKFLRHISSGVPAEGQVRVVSVTDKQFGEMVVFFGKKPRKPEDPPEQLLLF